MCFSAGASFSASAVILLIGVIAVTEAKTKPFRYFAVIPLLFAMQQGIEGLLWLVLESGRYEGWKHILTHSFLLFAYVVWPIYIPLSMRMLETSKKRRKLQGYLLVTGIIVSAGLVYTMIFQNVQAMISDYHIDYTFDFQMGYTWITNGIYLLPTVGSMLFSSVKRVWIMGVFNLLAYLFTKFFFFGYVVSIWCFFGALISTIVLWIIMIERRKAESSVRVKMEDNNQATG
ncbi:MAG: hypothetical protein NTU44_01250 [Bacteroidetes bacterium]|nr:hypothetical protein [Bacteroidota bacterium]